MIQAERAQACSSRLLSEGFVGELNWLEDGGERAGRVRAPGSKPCNCSPRCGAMARLQYPGSDLQPEHWVPSETAAAPMSLPLGLPRGLKQEEIRISSYACFKDALQVVIVPSS